MPDKLFWQDKRVLITGNTGFKGTWLSLWLKSLEAKVFGYALKMDTEPNMYALCDMDAFVDTCYADIKDEKELSNFVAQTRPEIVFHLAAQSLVRKSYIAPLETYAVNVMGTINLLEAVRTCPTVRAVVVVTSDKCYENREWCWGYRENDPLGGYDPYSSSKACVEIATSSLRRSFFTDKKVFIASARAGNVVGGGDWAADRIVPDIIRAVMEKRSVVLRNPTAVRPWQFVLEPLRGYIVLAEKLYQEGARWAEGWNFGPSSENVFSVEEMTKRLCSVVGGNYEIDVDAHEHEAMNLQLDISKAEHFLHWQPFLNFDQTIAMTADWYKKYMQNIVDMREYSLGQIERYQEMEM